MKTFLLTLAVLSAILSAGCKSGDPNTAGKTKEQLKAEEQAAIKADSEKYGIRVGK